MKNTHPKHKTNSRYQKKSKQTEILERFNEVERIARVGTWKLNIAKNEVQWSAELFRILDYDPDKIKPSREAFLKRVHPEDLPLLEKNIGTLLTKNIPFSIDHRIILPDGSIKFIYSVGRLELDNDNKPLYLYGIAQDISQHRKIEEDLRQSQLNYKMVADFTYDWEYWKDPDGNFLYVSPSCERISGYKPKAFIDDPSLFRNIILPEDRKIWDSHHDEVHKNLEFGCADFRVQHINKKIYWIEHVCQPVRSQKGEYLGLRASNRDITERKIAEEKLQQREHSLSEAQRIAHLGNWNWDIINNKIEWSDEVYRIFGLIPKQFKATYEAYLERIHPDDRERVEQTVKQSLTEPDKPYNIEHRVARLDGTERIIQGQGEVQVDDFGNPVCMFGTVNDITDLRSMEIESKRLRNELAHMDRIGTIGVLTASLAHEINQPLTAILTNTQAAQRLFNREDPDILEIRETLSDIVSDVKRAGEIIRRLRMMVKKEEKIYESYRLNKIIKEVLNLIYSEIIIRSVTVKEDFDPKIPDLQGDGIQMQQVILNLIMNALDAVKDQPMHNRKIVISTGFDSKQGVFLTVTDSGPGIKKDEIEKIFEAFYTTKTGGMGMGLSVCQSIIQTYGGRIKAENVPDGGARFSVWLPIKNKSDL